MAFKHYFLFLKPFDTKPITSSQYNPNDKLSEPPSSFSLNFYYNYLHLLRALYSGNGTVWAQVTLLLLSVMGSKIVHFVYLALISVDQLDNITRLLLHCDLVTFLFGDHRLNFNTAAVILSQLCIFLHLLWRRESEQTPNNRLLIEIIFGNSWNMDLKRISLSHQKKSLFFSLIPSNPKRLVICKAIRQKMRLVFNCSSTLFFSCGKNMSLVVSV